jgi:hypothetical protein
MMGYGNNDSSPSCLRLEAQPLKFNSGSIPPFQPMNDVPPDFQRFVPSMAVVLGNKMADMATINAAFTFLTNVVMASRYAGPLWMQMVNFGVMQLWLLSTKAPHASAESLLEEAAGNTIVLKASMLAGNNQIVFSALTPETQNQVRAFAQDHEALRLNVFPSMIQQFAQQMEFQRNPHALAQHIGGAVGHVMGNNTPGRQTVSTGNVYGAAVSAIRDPNVAANFTSSSGGDLSQKLLRRLTPVEAKPKRDFFSDEYGSTVQPPAPAPIVFDEGAFAQVTQLTAAGSTTTQAPAKVASTVDESAWRPFPGQLYKPAFVADRFELAFEQANNGGQSVVIAMVQIKDEDVKEEDHQLPSLNRMISRALAPSEIKFAGDVVLDDLELLVKGMNSDLSKEAPELTTRLLQLGMDKDKAIDEIGYGYSFSELISVARTRRIESGATGAVYFAGGEMVEDIVTTADVTELMQKLTAATSLVEVANILNKQIDDEPHNAEKLLVVAQLSKLVTDEVNFVLQRRMGLTAAIDDVLTDVDAMMNGLKNNHGPTYYNAFVAYEQKFVQGLFSQVTETDITLDVAGSEDATDVENADAGPATEVIGHVLRVCQPFGLVLVNMTTEEFGVRINGAEAHEVFESNFPGLQPFIASVVDNFEIHQRTVLVMVDGGRFGIDRSILGDRPTIIYNA